MERLPVPRRSSFDCALAVAHSWFLQLLLRCVDYTNSTQGCRTCTLPNSFINLDYWHKPVADITIGCTAARRAVSSSAARPLGSKRLKRNVTSLDPLCLSWFDGNKPVTLNVISWRLAVHKCRDAGYILPIFGRNGR
jgi:hypothetical protein